MEQTLAHSSGGSMDDIQTRSTAATSAEIKIRKIQEKNRRTQRAFRERQKERLVALGHQNESLTQQVRDLQSNAQQLQAHNDALNTALAAKEEEIQQLKEQLALAKGQPVSQVKMSEDGAVDRSGNMDGLTGMTPATKLLMDGAKDGEDSSGSEREIVCALDDMTRSFVSACSFWNSMVQRIAALLFKIEWEDGAADAKAALESAMGNVFKTWVALMEKEPFRTREHMATHRRAVNKVLSKEDWRNLHLRVLSELKFTPAQRAALTAEMNGYRMTLQALQAAYDDTIKQLEITFPADAEHILATNLVKAHKLSNELCQILQRINSAQVGVAQRIHRIWGAEQHARIIVKSQPFIPDFLFLLSLVGHEHEAVSMQPHESTHLSRFGLRSTFPAPSFAATSKSSGASSQPFQTSSSADPMTAPSSTNQPQFPSSSAPLMSAAGVANDGPYAQLFKQHFAPDAMAAATSGQSTGQQASVEHGQAGGHAQHSMLLPPAMLASHPGGLLKPDFSLPPPLQGDVNFGDLGDGLDLLDELGLTGGLAFM